MSGLGAGPGWGELGTGPGLSASRCRPSGSDGLVKLWTIKSNECVRTLDAHEDKVWGLHCSRLDDRALTAASDSRVILWKVCGVGAWGGRAAWGHLSDSSVTPGCDRGGTGRRGGQERGGGGQVRGVPQPCPQVLLASVGLRSTGHRGSGQQRHSPQRPCPLFPPPLARQQELDNLLHEKRYLRALGLAISLDRPHTVLTVIQGRGCLGPGRWMGGVSRV